MKKAWHDVKKANLGWVAISCNNIVSQREHTRYTMCFLENWNATAAVESEVTMLS